MTYGENFKKLRVDNKLTQKQVAEHFGIHQSSVSDWENDKARPEYEKLGDLAKLYNVSLYDLLMIYDEFFR